MARLKALIRPAIQAIQWLAQKCGANYFLSLRKFNFNKRLITYDQPTQ